MAKSKGKSTRGGSAPVSAVAAKPDEIQNIRNKVTNVIMKESVEMAQRSVQSVKEGGNTTALKYLWEVAGLFPAVAAQADREEPDSLARILLERLGAPGEVRPADETNPEADVESE